MSESDIGKIIQFRLNKELESSPIIIDDIYVNRTESSSDDVTRCITFRINSQNNTDYLEFKSIEFDIDFNPDVLTGDFNIQNIYNVNSYSQNYSFNEISRDIGNGTATIKGAMIGPVTDSQVQDKSILFNLCYY